MKTNYRILALILIVIAFSISLIALNSLTGFVTKVSLQTTECLEGYEENCNDQQTCEGVGGEWSEDRGFRNGQFFKNGYCDNLAYSSILRNCPQYLSFCSVQTDCENAGGEWCNTGIYNGIVNLNDSYCTDVCPGRCSSESYDDCTKQADCEIVGGDWCTSSYSNNNYCTDPGGCPVEPTCSKEYPLYCQTSGECESSGGEWIGYSDGSGSCFSCSSNKLSDCNTRQSCESAGGKWACQSLGPLAGYGNRVVERGGCYEQSESTSYCAKCGQSILDENTGIYSSSPDSCLIQLDCESIGGVWCDMGKILDENTKTSKIMQLDGFYCTFNCPKCTEKNIWACETQEKCTQSGGVWCENPIEKESSYCIEKETEEGNSCDASSDIQQPIIKTREKCESAGLKWWCPELYLYATGNRVIDGGICDRADAQITCTKCGPNVIENGIYTSVLSACITQQTCESSGNEWCNYIDDGTKNKNGDSQSKKIDKFYCTDNCPKCSTDDLIYCEIKDECIQIGGQWGKYASGGGFCEEACSKENPRNCYTRDSCEAVEGVNWCRSYCATECYENVECSNEKPWSCSSEKGCESSGNEWCTEDWEGFPSSSIFGGKIDYCANECYTCSETSAWSCFTQNKCESSGNEWCSIEIPVYLKDGPTVNYYYCSNKCYECSSDTLYGCTFQYNCEENGGTWCEPQIINGKTISPYCTQGACENIK